MLVAQLLLSCIKHARGKIVHLVAYSALMVPIAHQNKLQRASFRVHPDGVTHPALMFEVIECKTQTNIRTLLGCTVTVPPHQSWSEKCHDSGPTKSS